MGFKFLNHSYSKAFLLLILTIVGYYQISFHLYPLKYDMIDCYLPWRYYIGECLQQHQFPFWNPYQDFGYPIHADPSSGSWYPFVWFFGYFFGYDAQVLGWEYLVHIFIGGCGMYQLSSYLKQDDKTSLILSISYLFCGIYVGNGQHLTYVISITWIPFILKNYFSVWNHFDFKSAVKTGFYTYLLLTGGYPAFTIILFYIMLIYAITYFIKLDNKRDKIARILLLHLVLFSTMMIVTLPYFFSLIQVSPYLSRLGEFNLQEALFSPFSPQSFLSFIFPFSTGVHTDFFDSDLSMRNAYFGFLPFLFALLGFFQKSKGEIRFLKLVALVALTAAVGNYLPVREWLYKFVPFMNLFRFPSVFRYFVILGLLVSAGVYLDSIFKQKRSFTELKKPILLILSLLLILIILLRVNAYLDLKTFIINGMLEDSKESTIQQHIVLQSIIHIILLSIWLIASWKGNFKLSVRSLIFITATDLIITTQLLAPRTIYYPHISGQETDKAVTSYPTIFQNPSLKSIHKADSIPSPGQPYWKNMAIFQKEFSGEGFNSFSFNILEELENKHPKWNRQIRSFHPYFLTTDITPTERLAAMENANTLGKTLFVDQKDIHDFSLSHLKKDSSAKVKLLHYNAQLFTFETESKTAQFFTLLQKNYVGWKCNIDSRNAPLISVNNQFMGLKIPKGKHTITFYYHNSVLNTALIVSSVCLLILLLVVGFWHFQSIFSSRT